MALSDKNIVITPNIGSASDPQIVFSGASASLGPQNITLRAYSTSSGTLSFEGSAGQLFSITNSLTGTIFSVNDVSGIPSIEVLDTGTVRLAQYSGNVGIGIASPAAKLHVVGAIFATNDVTAFYSDERFKIFIGKINNPIEKIKKLNGYYFIENELAKSLGYKNDQQQVGVSAQEVQEVMPEVVVPAPIDPKYLTVKYEKLVPLLIEGIKAQQIQIDDLNTQMTLLKDMINTLISK